MGVKLQELMDAETVELARMSSQTIAIDAFNTIYQFLSIIRQRDGTPLMDARGNVTSHLSGLFYRTVKLYEAGIRPCYVFDGPPPPFKMVAEERAARKAVATEKLEDAKVRGDWEAVHKYAQQTAKLEPYMIKGAQRLLETMGVPWVQAPSEGEAQAAFMAREGVVWAAASQDFDALLFGAPRLLRNVTVTGKRKVPRKQVYVEVRPEVIDLGANLNRLGLSQTKLRLMGLLIGTDYNPGGVKGIGPKKAYDMVKNKNESEVLEELKRDWKSEWADPETLLDFFTAPPVVDVRPAWKNPDSERLLGLLVDEHGFSQNRVESSVVAFTACMDKGAQGHLDKWF